MSVNFDGIYYGFYRGKEDYCTRSELLVAINEMSLTLRNLIEEKEVVEKDVEYATLEQMTQAIGEMEITLRNLIEEKEVVELPDTHFVDNEEMVDYVSESCDTLQTQFLDLIGAVKELLDNLNGEVF